MMNNTAKKDPSGLWYLYIGAFFLFNPTYHIIDVLPDAIGYLLFITGLSKLAVLNDETAAARSGFIKLFILSAARLCLYITLPHATDIYILLCSFVFAIGEGILFIPAAIRMYSGFEFLEMRMNCPAAGGLHLKKKVVSIERLRNLTVAAFIARAVCSVLPFVPFLSSGGNIITDFAEDNYSRFASFLLIILFGVIALALSLPWLIRFVKYIKGITNDKDCCQKIGSLHSEWAKSNEIRVVSENMNCVMILLLVAAAFCFNMYVDGVNIFPTGIGALLVLAAFVLLRDSGKSIAIGGSITAALWAAMSAAGVYLQMDYRANNYRPGSAEHMIGKAPEMYLKMEIFGYIEAVFAAVTMLLMLLIFTRTLDAHAKKYAFYSTDDKKRFDRCLIPVIILWVLAVLMSAAIIPVMKFFAEIWLINGLLVIALFIFMYRAYTILYDGIYMKLHD